MECSEDEMVIHYEHVDDKSKRCIIENKDKSFSIRHFSQVPINTMTVMCYNVTPISYNRTSLCYCLPCVANPVKGVIYPPGTITSVRWDNISKGYPGGYFEIPIINIWNSEKEVSLKVSMYNLHIVGTKSMKAALESFELFSLVLRETYNFWERCATESELFMEVTNWLTKYSKNTKEYRTVDGIKDYKISWPCIREGHCPDVYLCREIVNRYSDIKYISQIRERSLKILQCDEPLDDIPELDCVKRSMVNYSYHIYADKRRVDLLNIIKCLQEKGYHATYHVTNKREIEVNILDMDEYEDDYQISKKGDKIYEQTLYITINGIIKHTGPGGQRHEKWYREIMKDLVTILF